MAIIAVKVYTLISREKNIELGLQATVGTRPSLKFSSEQSHSPSGTLPIQP